LGVTLCSLLAAAGCIATGQYKFLVPSAPGATAEIGYTDYHVVNVWESPDTVHFDPPNGAGLAVRACNREEVVAITVGPFIPVIPWPPSVVDALRVKPVPPLIVSIGIGTTSMTFDLSKVTLVTNAAERLAPVGFAAKYDGDMCALAPDAPLPEQPIHINGPSVVELRFDLPEIPPTAMLQVAGMDCGRGPVELPPIELHRASDWILYPFNT
jgi:hypothetical protein